MGSVHIEPVIITGNNAPKIYNSPVISKNIGEIERHEAQGKGQVQTASISGTVKPAIPKIVSKTTEYFVRSGDSAPEKQFRIIGKREPIEKHAPSPVPVLEENTNNSHNVHAPSPVPVLEENVVSSVSSLNKQSKIQDLIRKFEQTSKEGPTTKTHANILKTTNKKPSSNITR